MKKTLIAKAVSMACVGASLTIGPISSVSADTTTMYNLYQENGGVPCTVCTGNATDGWVYGFNLGPDQPVVGWVGTEAPNKTPFGYKGGAALHWAIEFDGFGSGEISNADSLKYGISADIDTAKGAWSDAAYSDAKGWRHQLEYGIIKSNVSGPVTLTVRGVEQEDTNFGFTILKGMDESTTAYKHHGGWNVGNNSTGITTKSLPGGGTSFTEEDIVAYSVGELKDSDDNVVVAAKNLNTISFYARANQEYTVALGGYRNGKWNAVDDGYVVNISQAFDFNASTMMLIHDVMALELSPGIERSLVSKLSNAQSTVEIQARVRVLDAFINEVEALNGAKISDAEAATLIADAQAMIDKL